jgi:hypothetical protein
VLPNGNENRHRKSAQKSNAKSTRVAEASDLNGSRTDAAEGSG